MDDRTPRSRLQGALALNPATFREIADDAGAIRGAVLTVIAATLLAGLGGLLWTQWGGRAPARAIYQTDVQRFIARSVLVGGAVQVGAWVALVGVTLSYLRSFGVDASFARLARAMGYAFAPMALQVLVCPPGLEYAMGAVALGYTFAALVAGAQAAADTTAGRAVVSVLAGFALMAVILGMLGNGTSDLAPGIFSLDPLPTSVGIKTLR